MVEWNRKQFNNELEALLNVRPPVPISRINVIRDLAISHPESYNYIVQAICKFIETSPPDYRVSGLFLIDAIIRRSKDKAEGRIAGEYRKRFSVLLLEGALTGLFRPCHAEDQARIDKMLNYWGDNHIYSKQLVEHLRTSFLQDTAVIPQQQSRPRQPVVLPTNYATEIALQQQGWQTGDSVTAAASVCTSISPQPISNNNNDSSGSSISSAANNANSLQQQHQLPPTLSQPTITPIPQQQVMPQLPASMTDFSNAVMHFLSALNYRPFSMGGVPGSYTSGNSSAVCGVSAATLPTQAQSYPCLSHTAPCREQAEAVGPTNEANTNINTNSDNEAKEIFIKTEENQLPACRLAEQMASSLPEESDIAPEHEVSSHDTADTSLSTATTTAIHILPVVKEEIINDISLVHSVTADRNTIMSPQRVIGPPKTSGRQDAESSRSLTDVLINEQPSAVPAKIVETPRTPPRTSIHPPHTPSRPIIESPRTPPRRTTEGSLTPPQQNIKLSTTTPQQNGESPGVSPESNVNSPDTSSPNNIRRPRTPPLQRIKRPRTPPRQTIKRHPTVSGPRTPPRPRSCTPPLPAAQNGQGSIRTKSKSSTVKSSVNPALTGASSASSNEKSVTAPINETSSITTNPTTKRSAAAAAAAAVSTSITTSSTTTTISSVVNEARPSSRMTNGSTKSHQSTVKPPKTPPLPPKKDSKNIKQPVTTRTPKKAIPLPKTPPQMPQKAAVAPGALNVDYKTTTAATSNVLRSTRNSKNKPAVPPPKTPPRAAAYLAPQKRLREPSPLKLDPTATGNSKQPPKKKLTQDDTRVDRLSTTTSTDKEFGSQSKQLSQSLLANRGINDCISTSNASVTPMDDKDMGKKHGSTVSSSSSSLSFSKNPTESFNATISYSSSSSSDGPNNKRSRWDIKASRDTQEKPAHKGSDNIPETAKQNTLDGNELSKPFDSTKSARTESIKERDAKDKSDKYSTELPESGAKIKEGSGCKDKESSKRNTPADTRNPSPKRVKADSGHVKSSHSEAKKHVLNDAIKSSRGQNGALSSKRTSTSSKRIESSSTEHREKTRSSRNDTTEQPVIPKPRLNDDISKEKMTVTDPQTSGTANTRSPTTGKEQLKGSKQSSESRNEQSRGSTWRDSMEADHRRNIFKESDLPDKDERQDSPNQRREQQQEQRHMSSFSPSQSSVQPTQDGKEQVYSYSRFARPGPMADPTLPFGTIRVLTRTLYVGPMSSSVSEEEIITVFSRFGEVVSVVFAKRPDKLKNAFVKFINRESLQAAKEGSDDISFRKYPVKISWAHDFGPKSRFDYEKGESILRLNQLSDEECALLKAAPLGGFQGSRLRDQVTVEEPGAVQQFTTAHREEYRAADSPVFQEVQKYEDADWAPQQQYASSWQQQPHSQYFRSEYSPPSNSAYYSQAHVQAQPLPPPPLQQPSGFYDQQGNYIYVIPAGYTPEQYHHQQQERPTIANSYYSQHAYPISSSPTHQYPQLSSPASPPPPLGASNHSVHHQHNQYSTYFHSDQSVPNYSVASSSSYYYVPQQQAPPTMKNSEEYCRR